MYFKNGLVLRKNKMSQDVSKCPYLCLGVIFIYVDILMCVIGNK